MAKKITKTKTKKAVKAAKKHPVAAIIIVAVLLVIVIAGVALYFVKPNLYHEYLGVGKHTYSEWVKTEPTCTADGTLTRYCTVCGEEETEVIPRLPGEGAHMYTGWTTTEPTCGEDGGRVRACTVCGEEESEVLPATGEHDYGDWETTDATCGEDGKKERTCTVCGEEESEVLPATGNHSYTETTISATCGKDGKITRHCDVCGKDEIRIISATGNHTMGSDNICTVCGYNANPATEFSIHFLELGNGNTGDCTLIKCGDTEVLIDAGSKRNSTSTVKAYIDKYCTDGKLEYVIATHAHEDHIAALVGEENQNNGVMYSYKIGTIITYAKHNTNSQVSQDFEKSITYAETYAESRAVRYTANQCYNETDGAKRQYYLDEEHTVSFNILYNYYYDHKASSENDYSVITLLTQELASGNKHYLFTGDLESGGESRMVDYYANSANSKSEFDILPKVEVYKAGHHGSETSSSEKLMKVIQPKYVAICCCVGQPEYTTTNANTFPTQAMLDRVGAYTDKIYATSLATDLPEKDANGDYTSRASKGYTSMNGNIVFTVKDDKISLNCSNNNTILKETAWFKENRTWPGV